MGKKLELWGGIGTAVYLLLISVAVGFKFQEFKDLKLNELGDFLAGVFGPIAFLWLVLGFLQQGRELKLSSDALQLQAVELQNSVEQQKEMVLVAREQVSAELEQIRIDRARRLAALEPIFAFREIYGYLQNGEYIFTASITNAGNKITDLNVSIDNAAYRLPHAYFPSLLHGVAVSFHVYLSSLDEHSEVAFTFSYKNDDGAYGSQSFKMVPIPPEPNRAPGLLRV
jgi:hypothetical protein